MRTQPDEPLRHVDFTPRALPRRVPVTRILERESYRGRHCRQVALGHGLRWSDGEWVEVDSYHPQSPTSGLPAEYFESHGRKRLEIEFFERDEAFPRDGVRVGPGRFVHDSVSTPSTVISADDLQVAVGRIGRGLVVATAHRYPLATLVLEPVHDLTPYRLGLQQDMDRRRRRETNSGS